LAFLNIAVDLYSGLVELGGPGQLLPAVDVRVVALREGGLQLLQLLLGEGGPVPSSAAIKGQCHEHCINYYRQGSLAPAAILVGEGCSFSAVFWEITSVFKLKI
jgi:hypothetical protein